MHRTFFRDLLISGKNAILAVMNLIILLCMPLVPAIIVTIYAVVTNKKANKHVEPKTA